MIDRSSVYDMGFMPKKREPNHESNDFESKKQKRNGNWACWFFVSACLLALMGTVLFSMKYIADLGQDVLLQFAHIAESSSFAEQYQNEVLSSDGVENDDMQTVSVRVERDGLLSTDYLAVVLPIFITLAGAFVVFLGMNRLKMYDERIDGIRVDLIKELNTMVTNQVEVGQVRQAELLKESLKVQQDEFDESMKKARIELEKEASEHKQAIAEAGQVFDWLKSTIEEKDFDVNIQTIFDAHKLVALLRKDKPKNYFQLIKEIINRVCNDRLSGDSDDYHNLSAELARGSMYNEAEQILNAGLALFPNDTDLIADLINYATKGGIIDKAEKALERLLRIDRRLWTWRCYIFSSDYYRSVGNLEAALAMCDACITALPYDQHGYHDKAEILQMITPGTEGIRQSVETLNEAVQANIKCPQCSNMLGKIYMEMGEYELALTAFNRCILDLAESQPTVSDAFVFYHRAACYDRMFLRDMTDPDLLVNAIQDYMTARKLWRASGDMSLSTLSQIDNRLVFLGRFIPEEENEHRVDTIIQG